MAKNKRNEMEDELDEILNDLEDENDFEKGGQRQDMDEEVFEYEDDEGEMDEYDIEDDASKL